MTRQAVGFIVALLTFIGSTAEAQTVGWPQQLVGDKGAVVLIYQPQVNVFAEANQLSMYHRILTIYENTDAI